MTRYEWSRQVASPIGVVGLDSNDNIYAATVTPTYDSRAESLHKYDPLGNLLWTREIPTGNLVEDAQRVAIESSGDAYVAISQDGDLVVTKYGSGGAILWHRRFGSSGRDEAIGIAVGGGNVYVVGHTNGSLDGNNFSGQRDAFVAKYDTNGTRLWVEQFDSPGDDIARGVAIGSDGNVYVVGSFSGTLYGVSSSYSNSPDTFLANFNPDGDLRWFRKYATYYGYADQVQASPDGGAYVTGFEPGPYIFDFIIKYDAEGTRLWIDHLESATCYSVAHDIAARPSGVYLTSDQECGYASVTAFSSDGARQLTHGIDLEGNGEVPWGVIVDSEDHAYVSGHTGNSFPESDNGFLVKFNPGLELRPVQPPPPPEDPDTDGDNLTDSIERELDTDPNNEDTDGDGLLDPWEVDPSVPGAGFDVIDADGQRGSDGVVDATRDEVFGPYVSDTGSCGNNEQDLRLPSPCAELVEPPDPLHKDLYLEVDWQDCDVIEGDGCPEGVFSVPDPNGGPSQVARENIDPLHHAPNMEALRQVRAMFDQAPVENPTGDSGVNLHVLIDESVAHEPECDQGESEVRSTNFGTKEQRDDTDIIVAKERAFRYVWSGHSSTEPGDEPSAESNGCPEPNLGTQILQGYGAELPAYDTSPFGDATAGGRDMLVTLGPTWICPTELTAFNVPLCYRNAAFPGSPGIFSARVEGYDEEFSHPMSRLMGVSDTEGRRHLWSRTLTHLLGQSLGLLDADIKNAPNLPAHDHTSGTDAGLGYVGSESYDNWAAVRYAVPSDNGPDSDVQESNPDYSLQTKDLDGDGTSEKNDNCPGVYNPDQEKTWPFSIFGDACNSDDDGDGLEEAPPSVPDPMLAQRGTGPDAAQGLAAETDANTAAASAEDGYDPLPGDTDNDGLPNSDDPDGDDDGVRDVEDNCFLLANPDQDDVDNDGTGNVCDEDDDDDGLSDGLEMQVGSDPLDEASATEFLGVGNTCSDGQDNDRDDSADGDDAGCKDPDNDTNPDLTDACPDVSSHNWYDSDGDGVGNPCDETPVPENERPSVATARSWGVPEGDQRTLTAEGRDPEGEPLIFEWNLDGDGAFETSGRRVTFDANGISGPTAKKVAVRATDPAGNEATAYSTVNVLDVPVASLIEPEEDTVLRGTVVLSAEASAEAGIERVEFLVDGAVVGTDDTAPYGAEWDTTGRADGDAVVIVRAADPLGARGFSAQQRFTVDNATPDTSIISGPDGPARETDPTFSWTGSDSGTDASGLEYSHRLDDGEWSAYSPATSVTFSDLAEGEHAFYVKARDRAGNEDPTPAERSFTVDTTAPAVADKMPDPDARNVPRGADVIATFSEDVESATVTGATFQLVEQGTATAIPATIAYDPATKKATLSPNSDLTSDTIYVATLKGGEGGVEDLAGNTLAADETWSFTTADTEAPAAPSIDLEAASDTGSSDTDYLTNDATPTLTGVAEANTTIKVYDGARLIGAATTSGSGAWSFTTDALADGARQMSATATDASGNTSPASATLTVALDTAKPTVEAPAQGFVSPSQLGASTIPVKLDWSGSDSGSGIDRYELGQSANGGSYSAINLPAQTTTTITPSLASGNAYRFRVLARDEAGNSSGWVEGSSFALTAYQENNSSVSYPSGAWSRTAVSSAYGGYLKYASGSGARAKLSFTGSEVAWVSTKGLNRGKAEVWVDGAKAATIDLYSSSAQARTVVFSKAWSSPGSHTLEVRVLGTRNSSSSGTRVDVDAFAAIR